MDHGTQIYNASVFQKSEGASVPESQEALLIAANGQRSMRRCLLVLIL